MGEGRADVDNVVCGGEGAVKGAELGETACFEEEGGLVWAVNGVQAFEFVLALEELDEMGVPVKEEPGLDELKGDVGNVAEDPAVRKGGVLEKEVLEGAHLGEGPLQGGPELGGDVASGVWQETKGADEGTETGLGEDGLAGTKGDVRVGGHDDLVQFGLCMVLERLARETEGGEVRASCPADDAGGHVGGDHERDGWHRKRDTVSAEKSQQQQLFFSLSTSIHHGSRLPHRFVGLAQRTSPAQLHKGRTVRHRRCLLPNTRLHLRCDPPTDPALFAIPTHVQAMSP